MEQKQQSVTLHNGLQLTLLKAGIRVNAIAPGFLVTKQNEKLLFNEDGTPTARTGKILGSTPMERFGEPEELNWWNYYS